MPLRPIISKIRCHNPNRRLTRIRNRNLLVYIATRDGVDLTPVKTEQEFLQREMYDDAEYDKHYLKYIAERPGSCGLFGNIDCSDLKNLASDVYDLSKKGWNIYNGVISLNPTDAISLGYDNKQTWVNLMNKVMPDIAKEFNIDITQLQWTAAVHMEKGHPHCQYMFWNKDKKVQSPYIHAEVQNRCRERISKEVFEQERIAAVIDKTAKRDFILEFGKELMEDEISYLFKNEIPGRIKREDTNAIGALLLDISEKIPTTGRLAYQFIPPEVKEEIDNITAYILKLPALKGAYQEYISLNREIMKTYSTGQNKEDYKTQRAVDDLKKRLGNQILKSAKEICFHRDGIINELAGKYQEFIPEELDSSILHINEPEDELSEPGSLNGLEKGSDELGSLNGLDDEPDELGSLHEQEIMLDESDSFQIDEGFIIEWNRNYKTAMKYLYDPKEKDIEKAIPYLDKEIKNSNVLAFYEKARLYEKGIVEGGEKAADLYFKRAFQGFKSILNSDYEKKDYIHYRLGKMYQYGQGTEKDEYRAVKEYEHSGRNKYAMYSLGNMYLRGQGVDITIDNKFEYTKEALHLFKLSANKQNSYAAYAYASLAEKSFPYITGEEVKKYYFVALVDFEAKYVDSPNDDLAFKIAGMYINGKGTEIDIDKGMQYLQESRSMNNLNAEYLAGKIYADADSKYYDMDEAIKSFVKVSESDSYMKSFASYQLGNIYLEIPEYKDMEKAIVYLESAASQENEYAQCKLGDIYNNPESEYYDVDKAREYYTAAAEQGSATGQYKLGKLYLESEKIPESIVMFEKSAEQGNTLAYYQLGNIYSEIPEYMDMEKAIGYLEAAASQANEYAQCKLGDIYNNPESEYYDVDKTREYYTAAAEQGSATGQYKLGKLYLESEKIPESIVMFKKAAEQGNTYAYYQLGKVYLDKENNLEPEKGIAYLQKGMQLGNENAQIEMGCQYLFGKSEPYIEKDVQKGIALISEVAEKGNEYAQSVLDFYENYRDAMVNSMAYGLCRNAFNMLTNANKQRRMDKLAENKLHRVHSKEMKKVLAKRGREVEDE